MTEFLKKILVPQLEFEGAANSEKFVKFFSDLYRIELFKDGLDLILTKLQEKQLKFEIKIIKGWDTNVGCFLTEQKSFYDKTLGKFFKVTTPKIILRSLSYNVLAHEMAHALEFESAIDLGEEFRSAIGFDMKNRQPEIITLKAEIKRLMVEALKAYPEHQFLSELFARYFELLSISRNVCAKGEFATSDVMNFFENTTNFIEKIFNPQIKTKIDPKIAEVTTRLAKEIRLAEPQQKFQERVESFHQKTEKSGQLSWTKNTKSNSMWQSGWKKYQELDEKK
jgi:hypothetical protein